jgi:hypothetical protein
MKGVVSHNGQPNKAKAPRGEKGNQLINEKGFTIILNKRKNKRKKRKL